MRVYSWHHVWGTFPKKICVLCCLKIWTTHFKRLRINMVCSTSHPAPDGIFLSSKREERMEIYWNLIVFPWLSRAKRQRRFRNELTCQIKLSTTLFFKSTKIPNITKRITPISHFGLFWFSCKKKSDLCIDMACAMLKYSGRRYVKSQDHGLMMRSCLRTWNLTTWISNVKDHRSFLLRDITDRLTDYKWHT